MNTLTDTDRILRALSRTCGTLLHTALFNKCQYVMNGKMMRTAIEVLKEQKLLTERWDREGHSYTLTASGAEAAEKALEQKR